MEVTCKVDFGDIEQKLKQIGPKLARKALRKAGVAVGKFWVDEVRQRVPVDTGDLRESIAAKVSTRKNGDGGTMTVTVGPMFDTGNRNNGDGSQQPAVYALFEEFGTKKSRPRPFMRPTFDSTAEKVVQILADTLRDDLEDVVKSSS